VTSTDSYRTKCQRWCGKTGTPAHHLQQCKMVQSLWKTVWRLLKSLNRELLYDPAILLLGIFHFKRNENLHINVHSSITQNTQTWKQPKRLLTDKCINKMWHIHIMEDYFAIKKWSLIQTTVWMNLETILLSERNQTQKTTSWMTLFMWTVQKGQMYGDKKQLVLARSVEGNVGWLLTSTAFFLRW
jgi:hypothetical protein